MEWLKDEPVISRTAIIGAMELALQNEDDVVTIAKHFYGNLSTHERLEFINEIRGVKDIIITTRPMEVGYTKNTYKTWNQTNALTGVGIDNA